MSMYTIRAKELLEDVNLNKPIYVIGCGSVGSYTVKALVAMGFRDITVFDDDTVSEENIGNQDFKVSQIGKPKAICLAMNMEEYYGVKIHAIVGKFTANTVGFENNSVVIMAVDSMQARLTIFNSLKRNNVLCNIVDCRMSIQNLNMYSLHTQDEKSVLNYKALLYDDSEAVQERCTNKAVSFTSLLAGGLMAKLALQVAKQSEQKFAEQKHWHALNYDIDKFDMIYFIK